MTITKDVRAGKHTINIASGVIRGRKTGAFYSSSTPNSKNLRGAEALESLVTHHGHADLISSENALLIPRHVVPNDWREATQKQVPANVP